jgi:hypothetical protein
VKVKGGGSGRCGGGGGNFFLCGLKRFECLNLNLPQLLLAHTQKKLIVSS